MKSPEVRNAQWRFANDAIGIAKYSALYLAQMRDDVCRRPGVYAWNPAPIRRANRVSSGEKALLRAVQLLHCGLKIGHENLQKYYSERSAASLLKRVGELQDARFAECRAKELQANWKLSADLAARNGDARNTG
jgi:hypothetical protein